ncbi:MAG: T9SS type A sorting domain-containing protein, partial [Saprospiraceae bacterium]|nr:T9SS type A sorting domain-containing protein [Saprospiraceae bacterium]
GNEYLVRNPNYSPFFSVRYRSIADSINNGESDILRYTLPAQAEVTYIRIISRLNIQQYYEAHLNTFYCPIGITPLDERNDETNYVGAEIGNELFVYPNPTDGLIFADLGAWEGEHVALQVFNSQGQRVLFNTTVATFEPMPLQLPQGIASGLYFLEVSSEEGNKEVIKFVVKQ